MADTLAQVQKDVRFWQRLLTFAGYKPGKVDGVNGRKTKAAGKMLGTASGPLSRWQERGIDWIAMGSDWGFMAQGFRQMLKERDGK